MGGNNQKKSFRELINEMRSPDDPLSQEEADMALRNISEFVYILYKINERVKLVPMEELKDNEHPPKEETSEKK